MNVNIDKLDLALEMAIHQQKKGFPELEKVCTQMIRFPQKKRLADEFGDKISKVLKKRFGIGFEIRIAPGPLAYVYPPILKPSVLNDVDSDDFGLLVDFFAPGLKELSTANVQAVPKEGLSIDLKKAYVKGAKNITVVLGMDAEKMVEHLSPREITSIILHEVGHVFNNLSYQGELVSRYAFTQEMANAISDDQPEKLKVLLHKGVKDGVLPKDLEVNTRGVKYIKSAKIMKGLVDKIVLPNEHWQGTNDEVLADVFSSRFGYELELATGLGKFYDLFDDTDKMLELISTTHSIGKLISTIMYVSQVLKSLLMAAGLVLTINLIFAIITQWLSLRFEDNTYDNIGLRITKLRQHYISRHDGNTDFLENIKVIESTANRLANRDKSINTESDTLIASITRYLISSTADVKYLRDYSNAVDRLLTNDLTVSKAELQAILNKK